MNRTGLIAALTVAVVVGAVFGIYPDLDIRVTALLFNPEFYTEGMRLALRPVRQTAMWLIAALVAPAILALALKLIMPQRKMLLPGRAVLFLIVTLALGPGLIVNSIAKEHWGRPRPIDVQQLGGSERFVAWWDPRGTCETNCSFVSGDVSGGFWTLAPAALAPSPWRPLAYAAAIVFGSGIAVIRMLFGGHFFTDAVFAGVFTFLIIWVVFNLLYRWQAVRLSDEVLEHAIERAARPWSLFSRQADRPPQPGGVTHADASVRFERRPTDGRS
ncbi:MAG: phosphatase PAP2 family protein [Rhizobiales bacterium]|nr:phosphatase PAP2 family protein [Hyphomicrobiales bacterium]